MEKRGIKVMLISPIPPPAGGDSTWAYKYLKYNEKDGFNVFHVNTSMVGNRALSTSDTIRVQDEIKRCFRIWTGIFKGIRKAKPDIVHMNTNCSPRGIVRDYISGIILKCFRVPYIIHCRCNVEDQISSSNLGIKLLRHLADNSRRVLVQNSFSLAYMKKICKRAKVEFMPNYIDAEYVADDKKINRELQKVLYVGHIRKTKGIDEYIEVAKKFPKVSFLLAGPITDDYSQEELENISSNIVLLGSMDGEAVKEQLDAADVFLFPSYTEGFSNAILEAMSRGLPIITTKVGANEDMLEGKGGCLVETKDTEGLIASMERMKSYDLRKSMSQWNIHKVKSSYVIDEVMNRLGELYEGIIYEKNN